MTPTEKMNVTIKTLESLVDGKKDSGISGTMVDRYIYCNKENCSCRKEGRKHGPYPVIQLYDNKGMNTAVYIGKKKKDEYAEMLKENDEFFANIKKLNKLYLKRRHKQKFTITKQ